MTKKKRKNNQKGLQIKSNHNLDFCSPSDKEFKELQEAFNIALEINNDLRSQINFLESRLRFIATGIDD